MLSIGKVSLLSVTSLIVDLAMARAFSFIGVLMFVAS